MHTVHLAAALPPTTTALFPPSPPANTVLLNAAANGRRFTAAVSDFGLARMCADHSGKHTETVGTGEQCCTGWLHAGILVKLAGLAFVNTVNALSEPTAHSLCSDPPAARVAALGAAHPSGRRMGVWRAAVERESQL